MSTDPVLSQERYPDQNTVPDSPPEADDHIVNETYAEGIDDRRVADPIAEDYGGSLDGASDRIDDTEATDQDDPDTTEDSGDAADVAENTEPGENAEVAEPEVVADDLPLDTERLEETAPEIGRTAIDVNDEQVDEADPSGQKVDVEQPAEPMGVADPVETTEPVEPTDVADIPVDVIDEPVDIVDPAKTAEPVAIEAVNPPEDTKPPTDDLPEDEEPEETTETVENDLPRKTKDNPEIDASVIAELDRIVGPWRIIEMKDVAAELIVAGDTGIQTFRESLGREVAPEIEQRIRQGAIYAKWLEIQGAASKERWLNPPRVPDIEVGSEEYLRNMMASEEKAAGVNGFTRGTVTTIDDIRDLLDLADKHSALEVNGVETVTASEYLSLMYAAQNNSANGPHSIVSVSANQIENLAMIAGISPEQRSVTSTNGDDQTIDLTDGNGKFDPRDPHGGKITELEYIRGWQERITRMRDNNMSGDVFTSSTIRELLQLASINVNGQVIPGSDHINLGKSLVNVGSNNTSQTSFNLSSSQVETLARLAGLTSITEDAKSNNNLAVKQSSK